MYSTIASTFLLSLVICILVIDMFMGLGWWMTSIMILCVLIAITRGQTQAEIQQLFG
jgi:hypothetical protein